MDVQDFGLPGVQKLQVLCLHSLQEHRWRRGAKPIFAQVHVAVECSELTRQKGLMGAVRHLGEQLGLEPIRVFSGLGSWDGDAGLEHGPLTAAKERRPIKEA